MFTAKSSSSSPISAKASRIRSRPQFSALEARTLYSADIGLAGALPGSETATSSAILQTDSTQPAAYGRDGALSEKALTNGLVTEAEAQKESPLDLLKAASDTSLTSANAPLEIILIDSRVPDIDTLRTEFQRQIDEGRNLAVMVIDAQTDGIQRTTQMLSLADQPVSALHIISHGQLGGFDFGKSRLSSGTIESRSAELATWSRYLSADADILVYGCDVAANASGEQFITRLGEITGADVAASKDTTGAKSLGADWDLEYHSGQISSASIASSELQHFWNEVLNPADFGPLPVNALIEGSQVSGAGIPTGRTISVNAQGDIAVTWTHWQTGTVMMRLFNPDGSARTGDIPVATLSTTDPGSAWLMSPSVAIRNDGTSVVTWVDDHSTPGADRVMAQRLTAEGRLLGPAIEVSLGATAESYARPDIAVSDNGNFFIVYESTVGSNSEVRVAGFLANGNAVFRDHQVGNASAEFDGMASIAATADGSSYVVAWTQYTNLIVGYDVYAQRFDSQGNVITTAAQSSATGSIIANALLVNSGYGANQFQPSVALAPDGSWVVGFVHYAALASAQGIRVSSFDSEDTRLSETNVIAGGSNSWNVFPSIVTKGSGDYSVVWQQSATPVGSGFANAHIVAYSPNGNFGFGSGTTNLMNTPGLTYSMPRIASNGNVIATDFTRVATVDYAYSESYPDGGIIYTYTTYPSSGPMQDVVMIVRHENTELATAPVAPTNITPGSVNMPEDGSYAFTLASGNALQIGDSDATGDLRVVIRVPSGVGVLSIANASMVTDLSGQFYTGPISGASLTIQGSLTNLNLALSKIVYTPPVNFLGAVQIEMLTTELYTGGLSDAGAVIVNVGPVNDAPSGINSNVLTMEDVAYVFALSNFGFSDSMDTPSDAFASVIVTTLPTSGILRLAGTNVLPGQEIAVADILAGKFAYLSPLNANGAGLTSFTFQVRDSGGTLNGGQDVDLSPNTVVINVSPVNDAPFVTVNELTITEGTRVALNDSMLSAADPDSPSSSLFYSVVSVANGQFELISAPGTAILTFTQLAIDSGLVVFVHDGSNLAPEYRLALSDGWIPSDPPYSDPIVSFTSVNDAPMLTYTGINSLSLLEDQSLTFSPLTGNAVVISDSDSGANPIELVISSNFGSISLTSPGALTLVSGSNPSSNMTLRGAVADLNNALASLVFTPNLNYVGNATLEFLVNDLGGTGTGGPRTDSLSLSLAITSVNDAPQGTDKTLFLTEGSSYQFDSADFGYSDTSDTPNNVFDRILITALPPAGTGTLTLNGTAIAVGTSLSMAAIDSGDLRFTPVVNGYGVGFSSIGFKVQDNGGTTNLGVDTASIANSININVYAINDAPTIDYSPTVPASIREDSSHIFSSGTGNSFTISDIDADATSIQLDLSASNGTIKLSSFAGISIASGANNSSAIRLTGTVDDLNAALDGLVFVPTSNYVGSAAVHLNVNDLGNTGTGGNLIASLTAGITVTSVNDAPSGADATIAMVENSVYSITSSHFGFSDKDDSPANNLGSITITALPSAGQLTLAGTSVGLNQSISVAQIDAGDLRFTPEPDANGIAYSSIGFTVSDDGTVANGGLDTSASPSTITINVSPVNDAPTIVYDPSFIASIREDSTHSFGSSTGNRIEILDIDSASSMIQLDLSMSNGTLSLSSLNGISFVSGSNNSAWMRLTGSVADLNTALDGLVFTPTANYVGPAALTLIVDDLGNTGAGGPLTASLTAALTVTSLNDAPSGTNAIVSIAENSSYQFTLGDLGFSDTGDSPPNNFAFITITTLPSAGQLTLAGANVGLNQSVSAAQIDAGLLRFTPSTNGNGASYASIGFRVTDDGGIADGGINTSMTENAISFDVLARNSAPTIDAPKTSFSIEEESKLVFSTSLANGITLLDPDAENSLVELTLSASDGTLVLSRTDSIFFVSGANDKSNMTIRGTLSHLNLALEAMTYTPNANFVGTATISIDLNDLGNSGPGGPINASRTVISVEVQAVNDAPAIVVPPILGGIEDAPLLFNISPNTGLLEVSDKDGNFTLEIALDVNHGLMSLGITDGLSFITGDGLKDAQLRFLGTAANINAALNSLVFDPDANYNGGAVLNLSVNDLGNLGKGGAMSSNAAINLDISPVNDLPVVSQVSDLSVISGEQLAISNASLLTSDLESGADLIVYSLRATPLYGELLLNGKPLLVGGTFTQADINQSSLSYKALVGGVIETLQLSAVDGNGGASPPINLNLTIKPQAVVVITGSGGTATPVDSDTSTVVTTAKADAKVVIDFNSSVATASGGAAPLSFAVPGGADTSENSEAQRAAGSRAGASDNLAVIKNAFASAQPEVRFTRAESQRLFDALQLTPLAEAGPLNSSIAPPPGNEVIETAKPIAANSEPAQGFNLPLQSAGFERMVADTVFKKDMQQTRDDLFNVSALDRSVVASTVGVSASFTIGYILWLVRGGVLISSLLASLPAWRMVDPLPVLSSLGGKGKSSDDKSLEELIDESQDRNLNAIADEPDTAKSAIPA